MTKVSWDARAVIEQVRSAHGSERADKVESAVGSIELRQIICNYHKETYADAYNQYLPANASKKKAISTFFHKSENEIAEWKQMYIACAANAIGYMQSAHAVVDTMAHVIYYALALEDTTATALKSHRISMHDVLKVLKEPRYTNIVSSSQRWISDANHKYLSDFTNQVKHRSLVTVTDLLELDPAALRTHGLKFEEFEKDGKTHNSVYIDEFINGFHEHFFTGVFKIGEEINHVVC